MEMYLESNSPIALIHLICSFHNLIGPLLLKHYYPEIENMTMFLSVMN
jgi:hypothetical protein